ncbi:MAG: GNAT family N-acetyltransferase/peptidase C39 family protein [Oleiphilus sp.]
MQDRVYRIAKKDDLNALVDLENSCFQTDKLSARSLKRWIQSEHAVLLVVEQAGQLVAYGLVWCHKGTRLARLYSLAVSPSIRGQGVAKQLLEQLEQQTAKKGRLYLRLEVSKSNQAAIALYEQSGYRVFGEYSDYYDDHMDALRMQKKIRHSQVETGHTTMAWYQQTTEFTCGPASLMMAMHSQGQGFDMTQANELQLWREATTIFMTSGHGGCHPVGLALSAKKRGFTAGVFLNTQEPLFLEGVRSQEKKQVMRLVHEQFIEQAESQGVDLFYEDISQARLDMLLGQGYAVLMLISTYRLDGKKAPHWVMLTSMDELCLYVHDPDLDSQQQPVDCQYLPIARQDFEKMSAFGSGRLRTAVAIKYSN